MAFSGTAKRLLKRCILRMFAVRDRLASETSVLLTFDDGPDPVVTRGVLSRLATFNARAVFFVVGNRVPRAPEMLQEILRAGHVIGNHTYLHPLDGEPPLREYHRDVRRCQDHLYALTGCQARLFRPPLGQLSIASLVAPWLNGLTTVLWSADVADWQLRKPEDAHAAGERLAQIVRGGDIILLHDDNPCVLQVLDTLLPRLEKAGWDLYRGLDGLPA